MPPSGHPPPPALLFLGFVVGVVSGMFGVGGGFLLTPLLNIVLGVPYPIAVGSGLCQTVGTAVSAFVRHRKLGQGEPRVGWLMLGGSLLGVQLGVRALQWLGGRGTWQVGIRMVPAVKLVLQPAYVLVLLATAFLLLYEARQREGEPEESGYARLGPLTRVALPPYVDFPRVGLSRISIPLVVYLGLALGFLSGLLGIGGGIALMPVLLFGFGFPIRQAVGTGSLLLLLTASAGTLSHSLAGHVNLTIAGLLLVGSSLGAQFGAQLTRRLRAPTLRRSFAVLLGLTALALLLDLAAAMR